jgi:hypothetical protein
MFLEVSNIFGVVNNVYRLVQVTVKLSHTKLFRAHYMITGQFGSKEAPSQGNLVPYFKTFQPLHKINKQK